MAVCPVHKRGALCTGPLGVGAHPLAVSKGALWTADPYTYTCYCMRVGNTMSHQIHTSIIKQPKYLHILVRKGKTVHYSHNFTGLVALNDKGKSILIIAPIQINVLKK